MPTLEITTMVGCPLKCVYCPQDALKAAYGKGPAKYLALADFKAMLAKVPHYVRIDFSGMAEPWANPEATAMLEHALGEGFSVAVYTTLYGMKDPERVAGLLKDHAGQVEDLVLHLPDRNGAMRGYKPSEAYLAALETFLRLASTELLPGFRMMTMDPAGAVHPSVAKLVRRLEDWQGHSRAGLVEAEGPIQDTPRHETVVGCSFTHAYDHNVLLPNGDVVLCCMDYSLRHPLGNLLTDDYFDLFGSPGMAEVRAENMRPGFSDASLCKSCVRAQRFTVEPGRRQFWKAAP